MKIEEVQERTPELTGQLLIEKEIVLDTLLVTKDNIDELYDTLIEVALTEE